MTARAEGSSTRAAVELGLFRLLHTQAFYAGEIANVAREEDGITIQSGDCDGDVGGTLARATEPTKVVGGDLGEVLRKGMIPPSPNTARATAICSGVRGPRQNSYQAIVLISRTASVAARARSLIRSGPLVARAYTRKSVSMWKRATNVDPAP
jgi:hypothetical protein